MYLEKIWHQVNRFCQNRVLQFGQQYTYFAIFGILNYPLAYFYQVYYQHSPKTENFTLRFCATFLCLLLLFYQKSPKTITKYIPLYWYFTLTFSIPFLGTYLLLQNNLSLDWIINMGVGLFILMLLVDWLMFIILVLIGSISSASLFCIINGIPTLTFTQHEKILGIYLYICIFICGIIFSSKKQTHQTNIIKSKALLNDRLTMAIKQKSKEILSILEDKKHFLQNFSHELRTPLHSILGLSEQLNRHLETLPKSRIRAIISMIYSSSFNLSEMINNLIDLSLYTSEKTIFTFKKTNFKHLITACIESNKAFLESINKNIAINLIYEDNLKEEIVLDSIKMGQVINNLISNAIKYSKPHSKQIVIHVKKQGIKNISCAIIDDGIGIPRKEKDIVFNAFVRGSNSKTNKLGKGLGLSIAKEIIAGHNGKIWVDKTSKYGTTIMLVIPTK
jgi:signal transduction histidine kinase